MPCTSPLPAWRPAGSGGRPQIEKGGFEALARRERLAHGLELETFKLDCGGCLSCRIAKQRDLAVRAYHSTILHGEENAWFLTLTYQPEMLPFDRGLKKRDLQLFLKRLRKATGPGIQVMACGEYGDTGSRRAHYHVALWGHSFPDRYRWKKTPPKFPGGPRYWLYRSEWLDKLWSIPHPMCPEKDPAKKARIPIGHAWIGDLTYESACYVAGYVTKKITGQKGYYHYRRLNGDGEQVSVLPEFVEISRGGRTAPDDELDQVLAELDVELKAPPSGGKGLGYGYYQTHFGDLFPKDYVRHPRTGKKMPVPRYYRRQLAEDPRACYRLLASVLRQRRVALAQEMQEDSPELREARAATLTSLRTKIYGHPADDEHLDPTARADLDRMSRRALPRGDHQALSRAIRDARQTGDE